MIGIEVVKNVECIYGYFFRGAFCSAELAVNCVGICEKSIACKKCPGYISNFSSSLPKKLAKNSSKQCVFSKCKKRN